MLCPGAGQCRPVETVSNSIPPDPIDLLSRLSDQSDGTILVWCFQFRSKEQMEKFIHSGDDKSPSRPTPSDKTPLPGRFHANGRGTDTDPMLAPGNKKTKTLFDYPLFTPLGTAIMRTITHEWQSAAELASACECLNNTKFYETLRALADRGFVEGSQRHGWRLKPSIQIEDISDI